MARLSLAMAVTVAVFVLASVATAEELVGKPPSPPPQRTAEQENPEDAPAPSDSMTPPPLDANGAAEPKDDPDAAGWALYESAVDAYNKGQQTLAYEAFQQFLRAYPSHPAAERARVNSTRIKAEHAAQATRQARTRARAGFILMQVFHGGFIGQYTAMAIYPNEVEERFEARLILAVTGGTVGGLVGAFATIDGIDANQALAINSGAAWAGFLTWTAARTNFSIGPRGRGLMMIAGHGVGVGAGVLVHRLLAPTTGQLSMVNSGGAWFTLLATGAFLARDARDFPPPRPQLPGAQFLAASGGLAVGGVLAWLAPMPRGRVLLIDLGGVIGAVLAPAGLVVAVGLADGAPHPEATWGFSAVGAAVGLGVAAVLTRNHEGKIEKASDLTVSVAVVPTTDGKPQLSLMGAF